MDTRQTILITGGAQRVGLHCARRLLQDGFRVVVTARHLSEERQQLRDEGLELMQADFSSLQGIQTFITEFKDLRPRLRTLIHNASLWLIDDQSPDALQQMFMVHMQAPMLINLACAELFEPAPSADIIHITDYAAQRGSHKHTGYCASKAGLENLSLSFAKRLAPDIKVNAIAPALIMFNEQDSPEYRQKTLAKSALGIEPGPDVVYQSIRYLMDNPYVTGTSLTLNGGRHLL